MESDWIGMDNTLLRAAVVILAVVESPGRRSGGGSFTVTTTLKSLASSLAVVCCEVATPVERTMALSPISLTTPWKTLCGIASVSYTHLTLPTIYSV